MQVEPAEPGAAGYERPHLERHGGLAEATRMQAFGVEADSNIPQGKIVFGHLSF